MVWSDPATEVHRLVVGPVDNNVYVVRCRRTGEALLVDAANEPERLVGVARDLGVTNVVTTHGHWDHIQAVTAARDEGLVVWVHAGDADQLSGYDHLIADGDELSAGDVRVRALHTPGHTPGSVTYELVGAPVLFTGDTLFPGGPGATHFDSGDFATIITSIEQRIFGAFGDEATIWPGHGAPSTLGVERPHLAEWVERGW